MSNFVKFNPEEWIRSDDDLVAILNDALSSGDQKYLLSVLGLIAKRQGMTEVAKSANTDRSHLYRMLSEKGNPSIEKTLQLFKALNIKLQATISIPNVTASA